PVMAHTASGRSATGSHGKDVSLDDAYLLLDLPYQTAPSAPLPIPQTRTGHSRKRLHLSIDDDRPPLFYATSAPTDDEELVLAAQVLVRHAVAARSRRPRRRTSRPLRWLRLAAGKGLHGHPSSIAMGFHGSHGHGVAGQLGACTSAHHAHNAHNATHIPGLGRIGPASSSASLLSASFPRTVTDIRRTSTSAAPVFSWLVDDSATKPQQAAAHGRGARVLWPASAPLGPQAAPLVLTALCRLVVVRLRLLILRAPAPASRHQAGWLAAPAARHASVPAIPACPAATPAPLAVHIPSSASSVVVSPNAKATKSRRKTANAESRLANREESVERKSASPSPSRSLGGSGRSRSSVPSLPSSQLSDGPVPMDTDTPLADLAATPPKAIPSHNHPMWRHGPAGYPDLCNKCGVKWMRGRILQDLGTSTSSSSVASTPSGFVAAAGPLSTTSGGGGTTHKSEG
ncbi:hypothetical protein BC831DRAFT_478536, partial [Entophlyctis helioformis]